MKPTTTLSLTATFLLLASVTAHQSGLKSGLDLSEMDRSVTVKTPEDLGRLANGKWMATAEIPADKPATGSFDELFVRNQKILHSILDAAAGRRANATTPIGRVGVLYRVAMDEARANRLGLSPISANLREIGQIHSRRELIRVIADLQSKGIPAAFFAAPNQDDLNQNRLLATFGQGGQILPDRESYWNEAGAGLRKAYVSAGTQLFALSGVSSGAEIQAKSALKLETALARVSSTPVELRDIPGNYHLLTSRKLRALTPSIDWGAYWQGAGIRPQAEVNVGQLKFFKGLNFLVKTLPLSQWRSYLRMQLLNAVGPYLSDKAVQAQFGLASAISGQREIAVRWKRAEGSVDGLIGEDLGQLYVHRAFPPQAKAKAVVMVHNLLYALRERIPNLSWMSAETKKKAIAKLEMFTAKIGYPDKWRDYSALRIKDDSWAANFERATQFEWRRQWNKLGKPIDRTEWGMTPPTVNAYYNQYNNEIVFPAGILQPGFYDPTADDAANYGAMGMVIGHEITHGFDDQGSQFDGTGKRVNWWTPEDKKNFDAAGNQIVKQYGALTNLAGQPVNGRLTLGENMADIGGLAIAYEAYQNSLHGKEGPVIDGFTANQRFFLAAAQTFHGKARKEYMAMAVSTDPHSPENLRAYVPSSDNAAFYKAFGLEVPSNLPHVW